MRLGAGIGAAWAAVLATAAHATPPTVIAVEDEPFGLSESEFFALRTTFDNLGSHFDSRHETFLVAIDLDTREQVMWHVDSVHVTTEFGETGMDDRKVMQREEPFAFANAFAILRERGGVPWRAVSEGEHWRGPPQTNTGAARVSVAYAGGESFSLAKEDAIAFTATTGSLLAATVPDYPRLEAISTRDSFALRRFESGSCTYTAEDFARSPLGFAAIQLVRVDCADEEELDRNSLLVPVAALVSAGE